MGKFQDLIISRRSTRKYSDEEINAEDVQLILQAALLAPTSKNSRAWHFIVVEDKEMLQKLSLCKDFGATPIANASLAIVVMADPGETEAWVEDSSIASTYIQLQAEELGLGSCWIQIRNRYTKSGAAAEDYVRELLEVTPDYPVLSIITLGHKIKESKAHDIDTLLWERINIGKWQDK